MMDARPSRRDDLPLPRDDDEGDPPARAAPHRMAVAPSPTPAVDPALARQAMRRLAGGVVVVTAGSGAERSGFTATSACSLSLEPPTMLVCVNRTSSTLPVIRRRGHFCINVLGAGHRALAERFAGIGPAADAGHGHARYRGADWIAMPSGAQGLADAEAIIDCDLAEALDRHSHCIILGAVRAVRVERAAGASLVYRLGQFAGVPLPE